MDIDGFIGDERTYDAVLRNLEVIGEAAKRVVHVYFALDDRIFWNAVRAAVPSLLVAVRAYLAK